MAAGGSIRKDPERGTWSFTIDVPGVSGNRRQIKRRGFPTKKAANAAMVEVLGEVRQGVFVAPSRLTTGAYLRSWLDQLPSTGRRPTTVAGYRGLVERHALPVIGAVRLGELGPLHIDAIYRAMHAAGLSARTIRFLHAVLGRAFADAERKGLIARNPVRGSTPPSAASARAPEQTVWTPDELRRFLTATADHHHGTLFRLAALTGLRRGEVLGLARDALDLDVGRLVVRQALVEVKGELVTSEPKTARSRRTVDLDAGTVAALRAHRAEQHRIRLLAGPGWAACGLVFVSPDGTPYKAESISQAFERAVRRTDLPRIRFHDLRHTHATHLLASGANARLVSERLGHSSVAFTLDTDGHVLPGQQASAVAAVAALVENP